MAIVIDADFQEDVPCHSWLLEDLECIKHCVAWWPLLKSIFFATLLNLYLANILLLLYLETCFMHTEFHPMAKMLNSLDWKPWGVAWGTNQGSAAEIMAVEIIPPLLFIENLIWIPTYEFKMGLCIFQYTCCLKRISPGYHSSPFKHKEISYAERPFITEPAYNFSI